jgi:predicted XRE-type DNA-binding protein
MDEGIIAAGDNVFADIGHPHPEEALAKAQLAHRIATIIKQRGLTQAQAAHVLATPQSKVSLVVTGQLDAFTIDRLLRFLTALDQDVEITVCHAQGPARLRVALG